MLGFVVRRVLYMIPVLLGVALLVFFLFNTVGEDPVRVALGRHATPQSIADLRHKWGLDQVAADAVPGLPAPDRHASTTACRSTPASR